jgi:hypothetical protein
LEELLLAGGETRKCYSTSELQRQLEPEAGSNRDHALRRR